MSNTNIPLSFKLGSGNLPNINITPGAIYLKQNTNNNKYINFNLYYGTDNSTIIPLSIQWDNIADKPIATSTSNGLMSSADKAKLEGIAIGANNYSLPTASSNTLGGIKIGYTQSDKNYPVELDSNNNAYVNVPWANTTYTNLKLGQGYATCSTSADTNAKTVTLSNYSLAKGGIVVIKFTNNVAGGSTLNINEKGAEYIYYRGSPLCNNVIRAGDIATFMYNGSYYHLLTIDRWQTDYGTDLPEEEEDLFVGRVFFQIIE